MLLVGIIFMGISILCSFAESKTTGLFQTFGVYGRFTAYLGIMCPLGIAMFISSFFEEDISISQGFSFLVPAAIGAFFIWNAYRKCPVFLKKKCIPYMMISGLGANVKLLLFFIGAVWEVVGPKEMEDGLGNTVYVYDGNVYDSSGKKIGIASADKKSFIRTE